MQNSANSALQLVPTHDYHPNDALAVFQTRLRQSMDDSNISCCGLARKSDVPEKTLRNILQGTATDPRLSTVHRLLQATNSDANWMLGLSDERKRIDNVHAINASVLEDMRNDVYHKDVEISSLRAELMKKTEDLSGKSECCAFYQREAARLGAELKSCKRYYKRLRIITIVSAGLLAVSLLVAVFVLWTCTQAHFFFK